VRDWWGPQRQTKTGYQDVKTGYQDVKECRRSPHLDLAQRTIEFLGVYGPIECRGWGQLDEGE
jgi:hypothetical protein